jgi:predicted nucleic acid-binding protein
VSSLVIDATVALKWVVEESGTPEALALLHRQQLIAPDLLVAECSDALWKKAERKELSKPEALFAARLLQAARIELLPMRSLIEAATQFAIELSHPAYGCIYLALAVENRCKLVTADTRLLSKISQAERSVLRDTVIPLASG